MGYFPNGTAGDIFENEVCSKCVHYGDCAVWDVHIFRNYDQLKKGNEMLRDTLNMLIPDNKLECKMFVAGVPKERQREMLAESILPGLEGWAKDRGMI